MNWCPELGTVLANEEVIDGKSEVGGFPVVRRPMRQWMLRITAYAERLIDELEPLDWPEGIKLLQRNWIGKSEGAEVQFALPASAENDHCFHDPPRHALRRDLHGARAGESAGRSPHDERTAPGGRRLSRGSLRQERSRADRSGEGKDRRLHRSAFAINPASGEQIPIWIADYVLMGYGTGAIMGVPAHDERDLEFAQKFDSADSSKSSLRSRRGRRVAPGEASRFHRRRRRDQFAADRRPVDAGGESAASPLGWRNKASAGARSITNCATGFSRGNVTGASHSRSSGATENTRPFRRPSCRWSRRALDDFKPTGTGEPPLARGPGIGSATPTPRRAS